MSVYKHDYRAYSGRVTPLWTRVLVLARYGLAEIWSSKITIGLFTLMLLPNVVFLILIYLANNPIARAIIIRGNSQGLAINGTFFLAMLHIQCWSALAFNAWIAPRLITFDLADNALPILLSHPISRFGYVLGKFLALFASLSLITWVPGTALFIYQAYSSQEPWLAANFGMGAGMLCGALLWIVLVAILGLALSSWVKWRVVATGIIIAAMFVPAGVGGIVSAVLRTRWGFLLNMPFIMNELWEKLLGVESFPHPERVLPVTAIVIALCTVCLLSIAMLNARIRAREIVRG